ncbi:BspA family leucine-rich repeat surface protein [Weeksellaceae bacterium KMM 9724]|uniref:BspA family leucine-rich repeat surface protein n=1 Tax=Profundicola chukchiensis TaxID=2961959 RepID=UPI0024389F18|nr:BspA family leucine-rich repeat surface protein [Profundicola chukchiensis]MDG4949373.1 BspA family leucine-rich repeat surface protein [Profundicola chukchiensis]
MKKSILLILAFLSFQLSAQMTTAQLETRPEVSLEMQTQIQQALSNSTAINPHTNRTMTYTYVGSFQTDAGPNWTTNPDVYSGVEAAAQIFGGNPSDYAISTNSNTTDPNTITHTAWASIWGITGCHEVAEDYSLDLGNPGYNDPGGANTATSSYVDDNCTSNNINHVWLVNHTPSNSFITTWQTTSDNESITIPTTGSGYNYNIDWGDGDTQTGLLGDATHTYSTAGLYTIEISGDFPRIYFNNTGDKDKIMSIEQWGDINWTSMENAFTGCSNLISNALDMPDLSMVTNMKGMFGYATSFNGDANIMNWDVSNVTNMHGMFGGASNFNADINNWNVENVSNMKLMFSYATSFNQDLSSWNVGSVINMDSMFRGATAFDQNIGNWNVTNVVNMSNMLKGASLSTENYDALLIGWSTQSLNNGIDFHAGDSMYCSGEDARQEIIDNFGWTITDLGLNEGCTLEPCGIPYDVVLTRTSGTTATFMAGNTTWHYQGSANRSGRPLRPYPMYGMNNMTVPHTQYALVPAFSYDIWLRTICDDNSFSPWAGPFSLPTFEGNITKVSSMNLSPNPTVSMVKINKVDARTIEVFDMSGTHIKTFITQNNQFDLTGLPVGKYNLRVIDAEGNIHYDQVIKK